MALTQLQDFDSFITKCLETLILSFDHCKAALTILWQLALFFSALPILLQL